MHKCWSETNDYIRENFPFRLDLRFPTACTASTWLKEETAWLNLVSGFIQSIDSPIIYELREDADYALWLTKFDGSPATFFFREEKNAIFFKMRWHGVRDLKIRFL